MDEHVLTTIIWCYVTLAVAVLVCQDEGRTATLTSSYIHTAPHRKNRPEGGAGLPIARVLPFGPGAYLTLSVPRRKPKRASSQAPMPFSEKNFFKVPLLGTAHPNHTLHACHYSLRLSARREPLEATGPRPKPRHLGSSTYQFYSRPCWWSRESSTWCYYFVRPEPT